jgi:hypothetical protein
MTAFEAPIMLSMDISIYLKKDGVLVSMATQGNLRENGYAERLIPTIKEAEVDLSDY